MPAGGLGMGAGEGAVPDADEGLIGRRGRGVISFVARRGSVDVGAGGRGFMYGDAEVVVSAWGVGPVASGAGSRLVVAGVRFGVG